ncbi:tRNA 2-thiouridine(34) synthase MnmA [Marinivivus vitaminiproducens]|uniref:tRNA 2-thiouridine(34) synthase MnmA n=1 Tax=Marinivivus vitaminiproducens TaxID=3035935 RepID=UPI0027A41C1C|nr:tRNA 2-thiouridine(34) synthase MnmA [Geminicoccaceae bacterium SCSIO 64248]
MQGLEGLRPGARVVVAMSGGVDSSVVAALVHEAGFEAIGITLQLYDHGQAVGKAQACCAGRDIQDARAVADRQGFAHYVLDYEARFKEAVIDDFADTYAAGRTPVPCIRCNQRVKFRDLLGMAQDLGAEALATGHYVRRVEGRAGAELHAAAEDARDQSYFLFATTQAQLDYLRFPLGHRTKAETRAQAERLGLAVADKPDSQDICFVPTGDYAKTVRALRPDAASPGAIVDRAGKTLGRHDGLIHYTVGQRKGLGVTAPERRYVLELDPVRNAVVIGRREELARREVALSEVNWLTPPPVEGVDLRVKHRALLPASPARVTPLPDGGASLVFAQPEYGVAPGQAAVFYDGSRVVGGGWIRAAERQAAA